MDLTAAAKELQKSDVDIQDILVEKAQDLSDILVLLENLGTTMKVGENLADEAYSFHDLLKCLC